MLSRATLQYTAKLLNISGLFVLYLKSSLALEFSRIPFLLIRIPCQKTIKQLSTVSLWAKNCISVVRAFHEKQTAVVIFYCSMSGGWGVNVIVYGSVYAYGSLAI